MDDGHWTINAGVHGTVSRILIRSFGLPRSGSVSHQNLKLRIFPDGGEYWCIYLRLVTVYPTILMNSPWDISFDLPLVQYNHWTQICKAGPCFRVLDFSGIKNKFRKIPPENSAGHLLPNAVYCHLKMNDLFIICAKFNDTKATLSAVQMRH